MLSENLRTIRKAKGISQEELAVRLHVVRQTVSKWEQGLSVPDADLLLALSEALETPVSVLLGESVPETERAVDLREIAEKLEEINLRLARRKAAQQRGLHWFFLLSLLFLAAVFAALKALNSPYLGWDYTQGETAVLGTFYHIFEWLFIRSAPLALPLLLVGACLTRKRA